MKKIILTGDRPTGHLHVGHYVGSLRERAALQNSGKFDEIYIEIADAQALTDQRRDRNRARRLDQQRARDASRREQRVDLLAIAVLGREADEGQT